MVRISTATATVQSTKIHKCIGCNKQYEYTMRRTRSTQTTNASPRPLSNQQCVAFAEAEAANDLKEECEAVPCPHCGLYQPEMVDLMRFSDKAALILPLLGIVPAIFFYFDLWPKVSVSIWIAFLILGLFQYVRLVNLAPNRHIPRTVTDKTNVPGNEGPFTSKKIQLYGTVGVVFFLHV